MAPTATFSSSEIFFRGRLCVNEVGLLRNPFFDSIKMTDVMNAKTPTTPSRLVTEPSSVSKTGIATTVKETIRFIFWNSSLIFIPRPPMASSGVAKRNKTIDAPIKFPTKISGSLSRTELIPTEISPKDVNKPRSKNETEKVESLSLLENFSIEEITSLDPNQIPKKESM